jgi:hypothetical protein
MVTLISIKEIDSGYERNPLATKWPCISWALLKPFVERAGLVSICVKSNHSMSYKTVKLNNAIFPKNISLT